jgi:cyclophilin family peptidyl-prolyl cis-trans isomerase
MGLGRFVYVAAVAAAVLSSSSAALGAPDVAVRLELDQKFYYEGDALDVRVTVHNRADGTIDNPIESALFEGFYVRHDGKLLERTGEASIEEPARPAKLAPGSFYGTEVDLVQLYPELAGSGRYEIYWSADRVVSEMVVATILPRFDPNAQYRATIETDSGRIVLDLLADQSPVAVKAFVDLANSGFYDGTLFSEVHADAYIVGGDPRFADVPREPILFPAERSTSPLVAGTVALRPVRAAPPTNDPTFVILLRPQPAWTGQVTVIGQVVEGLDLVQRISQLPSTLRNSDPNFKPLQDVKILGVTIGEKPQPAAEG